MNAQNRTSGPADGMADRLKELADEAGSIAALARLCDVPSRTVTTWISDGRIPASDDIAKVAEATGVSLDWLISGIEPKKRGENLFVPAKNQEKSMAESAGIDFATLERTCATMLYGVLHEHRLLSDCTPAEFSEILDAVIENEIEMATQAQKEGRIPPPPNANTYRRMLRVMRK